jgi:ADP-ribose pyrophosphatase YjhB (NUDIX family)
VTFDQDQFFQAVASRRIPRIRIAGIVAVDGKLLVQRPRGDANSCFAFIGGEYEIGDTFESRLRKEFEEETNARVVDARYLFCVESRYRHKGNVVQQVDHFFSVDLDRQDVVGREAHLEQIWLPLSDLPGIDLQPTVVRDAICDGSHTRLRHLMQIED